MGHQKRRVKLVTHIRLASVGEENICGGVVRGIGSTDIRIRSRGVLYSSTSTVVSTRSLCPSTCLECPIVFVPVSSSPSCAWNLARGSVVVDCGYSEGHFHSIRQRFHACFLDIRDRKLAARTVSSKHVAMHSVVSMSSSFSVVSGVGFVE